MGKPSYSNEELERLLQQQISINASLGVGLGVAIDFLSPSARKAVYEAMQNAKKA